MDPLNKSFSLGVWFLAVKTGTGTDIFTETLADYLSSQGVRNSITWLPHRAEYAPWSVAVPPPPDWATVIHVNTWLPHRFLPKSVPVMATMHLCVHDPVLQKYKGFLRTLYHRFWIKSNENKIIKAADELVAVSESTARVTKQVFGLSDVSVIHNGIITNSFNNPINWRVRKSPFRLLYVGSWSKRKGTDLLAPIMEALGPDYELFYTATPSEQKRGRPMPENCRCIGRLSKGQLEQIYLDADAFIFPSRLEGLALVLGEAMIAGLPVIASNTSSMPEIVDNDTGILCNTDSVEEFVAAAKTLSSEDRRCYLDRCVKAFEKARSQFDIAKMGESYLERYKEISLARWNCES
ncbi:MAG: glycosyltransferase family 4 protein [Alcanivorax sp.]